MNDTNLMYRHHIPYDHRFEYSHYYGNAVYDNP